MSNVNLFLFLVVVLVNLILGYVVYSRNSKNQLNRLFIVFIASIVFWCTSNFLVDVKGVDALFWTRLTYLGSTLISIFLVYFSLIFPSAKKAIAWWKHLLILSISILILILFCFTNLGLIGITHLSWGVDIIPGQLYFVYPLYFFIFSSIALAILWQKYTKSKGIERPQIFYVFLGLLLSLIFGFFTNSISYYMIGNYSYAKYGPYTTIFVVIFTAYAIITQRLFDIRIIIRRTFVFAGLSIFVLGAYVMLVFLGSVFFGDRGIDALTADTFIPSLIAAFAIAVGFDPIRHWLSSLTDNWLYKGEYTSQQILTEISHTVASAVNLSEAIKRMIEVVVKSMRLTKGVALLVQPTEDKKGYEQKQVIVAGKGTELAPSLEKDDALISFFLHSVVQDAHEYHNPVVTEELARKVEENSIAPERQDLTKRFLDRLNQLGASAALPLFISRQQPKPSVPGTPTTYESIETFIGVLVLGEKRSGDSFSDQDLNLLEIVATETASAVEKSRLFEEDQLKTEFVAVASHELLTPTAAIEGYLSMILDENKGKIDDEARGYLTTVYQESKRLAGLVNDLLNVSRIERGKIVVKLQKVNLAESVTSALNGMSIQAKNRKMTVQFTPPASPLPEVSADPEKLTEVLINLVGNAIKYTPEGGHISVAIEAKPTLLSVSVADNGIGMKPEDMAHLFEKFFRGSNSDATAQTGTGLGLYITKNVIGLMGGNIDVQSTLGKGSTFTFTLPIAK